MLHHDASKLTQRWNDLAQPDPMPLPLSDSLPDSQDRIGWLAVLRSALDPDVLVYATIQRRIALRFLAQISGFSLGSPAYDDMAIGDTIEFDESYVVGFAPPTQ